jgi:hypothetical protein
MPPAHPGWCIHISRRRHVCNAFDLELIVVVQAAKNKRIKCRFPLCLVHPQPKREDGHRKDTIKGHNNKILECFFSYFLSFHALFDIPFGVLPVYVLRYERWLNGGWQRIISKPHPAHSHVRRGDGNHIPSLNCRGVPPCAPAM